jgi:hypothetical protein
MLLSVMIMACAGNGKKGQGSESKKIGYRIVETASGAVGGNELWATKDGEFRNTEIEAAEFLEIIDQRDYDGDGLEEAFVCQSTGGSGHLPEFIVYFDKDANVFRKVEFNNIGVFLNDSIEEWNGIWSFYGGDDAHYERFIFEKGRIVKVENYTKPQPEGAEALLTISPNILLFINIARFAYRQLLTGCILMASAIILLKSSAPMPERALLIAFRSSVLPFCTEIPMFISPSSTAKPPSLPAKSSIFISGYAMTAA